MVCLYKVVVCVNCFVLVSKWVCCSKGWLFVDSGVGMGVVKGLIFVLVVDVSVVGCVWCGGIGVVIGGCVVVNIVLC